jgi:ribosome-binding protein aMBF1 (putative translation factor)
MTTKKTPPRSEPHTKRKKRAQIPNDDLVNFGHEVRRMREAQDISQEELGFRAGLHRNFIGYVERAEENATMKQVIRIARALKLRPSELVREMTWPVK